MGIDPEILRRAMREWATGVTVVSALADGVHHGMTVNSFTSVALEPPLLLVSLERTARTHGLVDRSGIFGVSILDRRQREISDRFAGRETEHADRFEGLSTYTLVSGVRLLDGTLAGFDCRVVSRFEVATHTLFIGEVLGVRISDPGEPLLYYQRGYWHLGSQA
jgi:flavin reductase (DIM6/NTAB) family NADH-FMN oxidoreductase RutF